MADDYRLALDTLGELTRMKAWERMAALQKLTTIRVRVAPQMGVKIESEKRMTEARHDAFIAISALTEMLSQSAERTGEIDQTWGKAIGTTKLWMREAQLLQP